jgi:hypothetical protein
LLGEAVSPSKLVDSATAPSGLMQVVLVNALNVPSLLFLRLTAAALKTPASPKLRSLRQPA